MSALARFPPLFPSAPFPVWVMVWVSGFPAQDLHRYKQERASCLKFRGGEAILSSTAQATHCRPGFWGHQFTHRWVGQAEHLACRKRPPGAFAGVARTHFCPGTLRRAQARGGRARESPCCRRTGPVCRFRGWGGARVPLMIFRRRRAVCGAAAVRAIQLQRKNASGSPVWGPLGVFDFSTRIKDRRR